MHFLHTSCVSSFSFVSLHFLQTRFLFLHIPQHTQQQHPQKPRRQLHNIIITSIITPSIAPITDGIRTDDLEIGVSEFINPTNAGAEFVGVLVGTEETEPVGVLVAKEETEPVVDIVGVLVAKEETDPVGDIVGVLVGTEETEPVGDIVGVPVGVEETDEVEDRVGVPVGVEETDPVGDIVGVTDCVPEDVGDRVGVTDCECDDVLVEEPVKVAV